MSHDVLVIGGGIIGMLTAHYLQKEGFDVTMVEKNQVGGEASWAAGGILSKLYPWQQSQALQNLVAQGQLAFPKLVSDLLDETGIDPQLLNSGMLIVDIDEKHAALKWAQDNNSKIEHLDRKGIDLLEPNLEKCIEEALYLPSIMQVRPPELIKAVKQSLLLNGVRILEGVTAKRLILQSTKVTGIETNSEPMFVNHVVICNGAWAQQLLEQTNPAMTDIQPVRGQMLLFKTSQSLLTHIIVKDGYYLIPRKDRFVLCGSTIEHTGFNQEITQQARDLLSKQAYALYPSLKEEALVKHWSALRPGTAREMPYVCEYPGYEGLYINVGHYRYGIVTSIPTAKMASKLITNKVNSSQFSAYA